MSHHTRAAPGTSVRALPIPTDLDDDALDPGELPWQRNAVTPRTYGGKPLRRPRRRA